MGQISAFVTQWRTKLLLHKSGIGPLRSYFFQYVLYQPSLCIVHYFKENMGAFVGLPRHRGLWGDRGRPCVRVTLLLIRTLCCKASETDQSKLTVRDCVWNHFTGQNKEAAFTRHHNTLKSLTLRCRAAMFMETIKAHFQSFLWPLLLELMGRSLWNKSCNKVQYFLCLNI